jgi:hypothetical protein
MIQHGLHKKWHIQQFFNCCVYIRFFLATYIYRTRRLMGGIYEVHHWDGLRCHDIHTRSRKDWLRHSNVNGGDTQTHRQHGDRISLLLFFQNKESKLFYYLFLLPILMFLILCALSNNQVSPSVPAFPDFHLSFLPCSSFLLQDIFLNLLFRSWSWSHTLACFLHLRVQNILSDFSVIMLHNYALTADTQIWFWLV